MLSYVLVFFIILIFVAMVTIRYVPMGCRMLIVRHGKEIVLFPGINFLIPFVDKVLVYARISYENAKVCDFWIEDIHYHLLCDFSLKNQSDFTEIDVEALGHFPKNVGAFLQEILEHNEHGEDFDHNAVLSELKNRLDEMYDNANFVYTLGNIEQVYDENSN